ncbi:MAG: hypothetical protein BGN83_16035 [Rhizobium sp. 63-7]|nr:MAG: hypothetical protein BGN83_16035 [Rhizobium sp. 63-7]
MMDLTIANEGLNEAGDMLTSLFMMAETIESPSERSAFRRVVEHTEAVLDSVRVSFEAGPAPKVQPTPAASTTDVLVIQQAANEVNDLLTAVMMMAADLNPIQRAAFNVVIECCDSAVHRILAEVEQASEEARKAIRRDIGE